MLLSAVYEQYDREELETMLWQKHRETIGLKTLLTTCIEEMYALGSDKYDLMALIEDQHRTDWHYNANYCVGAYNQMRKYIADLENLLGKDKALKIRNDPHQYLCSWWDATEPK